MFEKALPLAKDKNVPIVLSQMAQAYAKAADAEQNKDARTQDQQKAIETYQKAMAISPNDAGLHNNLGSIYATMGKVDDAKAEFQKAADLDPTHAGNYYYNLGVVMVNQGKMDDASVALKKATDIDANNANAFYWYGMALLGKAETKPDGSVVPVPGTIEAFETYLKLQPNGPWAQAAQASIEQLKATVPTEYKKTEKEGLVTALFAWAPQSDRSRIAAGPVHLRESRSDESDCSCSFCAGRGFAFGSGYHLSDDRPGQAVRAAAGRHSDQRRLLVRGLQTLRVERPQGGSRPPEQGQPALQRSNRQPRTTAPDRGSLEALRLQSDADGSGRESHEAL